MAVWNKISIKEFGKHLKKIVLIGACFLEIICYVQYAFYLVAAFLGNIYGVIACCTFLMLSSNILFMMCRKGNNKKTTELLI